MSWFSSKPKAAKVPLRPRKEHLESMGQLLQVDLDTERQELVLGHISRLYELIQALGPTDQAIYYTALQQLQKLVEANAPNTRKDMLLYLRAMNGKERFKKAA